MNFDNLLWLPDRLIIRDLVFRLVDNRNDETWDLGENCLALIKSPKLLNSYAEFFKRRPAAEARNIVDIGMYAGGSIALWNEIFRPDKLIGIDMEYNQENDYFRSYLAKNKLSDRIATFWNTDQSDEKRLKEISMKHMGDGIDIVFDDASHFYGPTKHSFQALFPFLRPGGLYIIEDWNWAHTAPFQLETSIWRDQTALTRLVFELVEAVGSSPFISNVHIYNGFAAVERSHVEMDPSADFRLDQIIVRRPNDWEE